MTIRSVLQIDSLLVNSNDWYNKCSQELQKFFCLVLNLKMNEADSCWI